MNDIALARKQLLRLMNRCDGCQYQNGKIGEKTLIYCEPCTNYRAMNKQREELENMQRRWRLLNDAR